MSDIIPARFNPIPVLNKIAWHLGHLVSDRITTKSTPVNPYKVSGGVVEGNEYTVYVTLTNHNTSPTTSEDIVLTYTAVSGDTELDVLQGVAGDNTNENLNVNVDENLLDLSLLPADMFSANNTMEPVNLEQAEEVRYVPTGIPASYLAYQKIPVGSYPLLTFSLLPMTPVTNNMGYGSREVAPDEFEVYTDRYMNFSVQVLCDAGKYEQVIKQGSGGSIDILNTLLARLDDNEFRRPMQEDINSVYNQYSSIIPSPTTADVEPNDVSSVILDFSTVDQNISGVGVFDTVIYDADYYTFKGGELVLQTTNEKISINNN